MCEKESTQPVTAVGERRSESRIKVGNAAILKAPNMHPIEAWVLDVCSGGLGLRVPESIAIGTCLRFEADEMLLFGNVTHCGPSNGAYYVGMALARPLEMFAELQKLNASLLVERKCEPTRDRTHQNT